MVKKELPMCPEGTGFNGEECVEVGPMCPEGTPLKMKNVIEVWTNCPRKQNSMVKCMLC